MVKPNPAHEIHRFQSQRGGIRTSGRGGVDERAVARAVVPRSSRHLTNVQILGHYARLACWLAQSGLSRGSLRLAAPKSVLVVIGSLHRLSRPQQQGRRSVTPLTPVPFVPACGLCVNAIGGGEGGVVIAKKLNYALASDIESPAFVPFRANPEGADR